MGGPRHYPQPTTQFYEEDQTIAHKRWVLGKGQGILLITLIINNSSFTTLLVNLRKEQRRHPTTAAAAAKSLQSCPTLCDPIDGSPPGSPVPGILQARTLEWVAISFSNA